MAQTQEIIDFIKEKGSMTTMDAFDLGITRLASRIHELRKFGYAIISIPETAKNRHGKPVHYVRYRLAGKA